ATSLRYSRLQLCATVLLLALGTFAARAAQGTGSVSHATAGARQPPPAKTNESAARLVNASGRIDQYYPAPHETQIKSRIESTSSPNAQGGGSAMLMKNVKVQTWLVNGQPELVLDTPECTYDQKGNVFSSPGPLKI